MAHLPGVVLFLSSPVYYNQMVVDLPERSFSEEEVDLLFHALADRTRRDIMGKVSQSEHSISDLARQYEVSFAAIQKHVSVLEKASLVTKELRGRQKIVRNNPDTLHRAAELLTRYEHLWTQRIDAIGQILAEQQADERKNS